MITLLIMTGNFKIRGCSISFLFPLAVLGVGDWPSAKCLSFSINGQDLFKVQKFCSFPHIYSFIICLTSHIKKGHWTGTCPHHVPFRGWLFQSQKTTTTLIENWTCYTAYQMASMLTTKNHYTLVFLYSLKL